MIDTAHSVGVPLIFASQLLGMMQAIKQDECGGEDHFSIVKYYEKITGIEVSG